MNALVVISVVYIFGIQLVLSSEIAADHVVQPVELDEKEIVKRQATSPPPRTQKADTYTSVRTNGGCKIYALDVIFFKKTVSGEAGAKPEIVEVHIPGSGLSNVEGSCANYSGTVDITWKGDFKPSQGNDGLTDLKLSFNISHLKTFGWWELSTLGVVARGKLVGSKDFEGTFEGNVMRSLAIGAAKRFSYACGQPPTLFYSMDLNKNQMVYGLKFKNLQIQPFEWGRSKGNFTNEVDDCVPFFSIGIWMFLVVAAVLLLVVFFGIGMISSLKTMDRFDDPKGKPMVINTKE